MSKLSARDVEMVRFAAAVLDGSHPYDEQTIAAMSGKLATELRAIARAHCDHARVNDGVCRYCDTDFGTGGRAVLMVGSAPGANLQHPAGPGPTSNGGGS